MDATDHIHSLYTQYDQIREDLREYIIPSADAYPDDAYWIERERSANLELDQLDQEIFLMHWVMGDIK